MNLQYFIPLLLGLFVNGSVADTMKCNLGNGHRGYCVPGSLCNKGLRQSLDMACLMHRAGHVCCESEFPSPTKREDAPKPTAAPNNGQSNLSAFRNEGGGSTVKCNLGNGHRGWCVPGGVCGNGFRQSLDISCSMYKAGHVCCEKEFINPIQHDNASTLRQGDSLTPLAHKEAEHVTSTEKPLPGIPIPLIKETHKPEIHNSEGHKSVGQESKGRDVEIHKPDVTKLEIRKKEDIKSDSHDIEIQKPKESLGNTVKCNLRNGHRGWCVPGGVCGNGFRQSLDISCSMHRAGYVCCESEFPNPPKHENALTTNQLDPPKQSIAPQTNQETVTSTKKTQLDTPSPLLQEVYKPDAHKLEGPKLESPDHEIYKPESHKSEINKPEVQKTEEDHKTDGLDTDIQTPDGHKTVDTGPEAHKMKSSETEMHKPVPHKTESVEPDHKPAVDKPEINRQVYSKPEIQIHPNQTGRESDVHKPEVEKSDLHKEDGHRKPEVTSENTNHKSVSTLEQVQVSDPAASCHLPEQQKRCTTKCDFRFGKAKFSDADCSLESMEWDCCDMWFLDEFATKKLQFCRRKC